MQTTFTTRTEVEAYIVGAIEATGVVRDAHAEFDIDAIVSRLMDEAQTIRYENLDLDAIGTEAFWAIVQGAAL